jgi:dihydrodipicolinate synthase/N-acetylneuraminate lyase
MVYGNPRAFRFKFEPEFWARIITEAPTVISAKFSRPDQLAGVQAAARGKIHFLPNDAGLLKFTAINRAETTACWSTAASMGPEPALALMNAVLANDPARETAIAKDNAWTREPIKIITENPETFASYNLQMEKIRANAAGYMNAGPIRPPYDVVPDEFVKAATENGLRWKELRKKYAGAGALA